jgi:hypothetical protein
MKLILVSALRIIDSLLKLAGGKNSELLGQQRTALHLLRTRGHIATSMIPSNPHSPPHTAA